MQPNQVLGATRAIQTLTFNQGGFTVTGNALTLNNSGAGIFSTGSNTIGSDLYPQVPVTYQSNAGMLTLAGVVIANSAYYPNSPAAPTLNGAGNFTVSGSIQGAGGLVMNGTGTLLLSGTNYNAGSLTINSGTLKLASATTIANNGALIVNSGGVFDLNGLSPTVTYLNGTGSILLGANTLTLTAAGSYASPSFTGTISGSGGIVVQIDASGVQTLGDNNTYTGGTVIKSGLVPYNTDANFGAASGSLLLNGGGLLLNKSVTVTRPITVGSGGALLSAATNVVGTFNSIVGSGPVTYGYNSFTIGNNVWLPAAGCTYTGTTNVLNGTLVITDNSQLGAAGNAVVASGGTVLLRGGITIAGRTITPGYGAGGSTNTNGALASDTGNDTWAGPVTVGSSAQIGAAAGTTLTLSGPVSGSGSLGVLSIGDTFISGTVTSAAIYKADGGTLTLSGNNASGGNLTVGQGIVILQGGNAVADTGTVSIAQGATLRLAANETIGALSDYGNTGAAVDLGSYDLTLSGGTFSGNIGGTGRVFMEGTGTLSLSGNNTFSGGLYVDSGTLYITSDAGLGAANNPVVLRGGSLQIYGSTAPSLTHALTFSTPDVSLNVYNGTFTLGQPLTNTGSLTKLGAGTLVLNGTNSYGGGTVLSAGTLSVSSDASLGATGGGVSLQSGTLQITGNTFHSTTRPVTSGTGYSGFDIADPTNTFTLGAITGSAGGITKLGAGTLVMAGQTTLSTANANVGTLRLGASNVFTANSSLSVATGATFDLAGFNQTAAYLGVSGALTTEAGTLSVSNGINGYIPGGLIAGQLALTGSNVTVYSNYNGTGSGGLTIAAAISGNGTLTMQGTGSLVLAGNNPFAGTTVVNAGTLSLTGSLLHTVGVTVAQGALLEVAGGQLGVNGNLINNGFLRLTGSATLAATGSITNNGVVDISHWNGVLPANIVTGKGGVVLDATGLQITQIARSTAAVQVTVNGLVGLSYQLQRATSLTLTDWQGVGTSSVPQAATVNGPLVLTDGNPLTAMQGFYRVIVSQTSSTSGH